MTAKTVTIDHPHAEVIAAYYSGKTAQLREGFGWKDLRYPTIAAPRFSEEREYRIKPEPLVRWVVVDDGDDNMCFTTLKAAEEMVERYAKLYRADNFRIVRMVEMPE
jgi:hypothetical protein